MKKLLAFVGVLAFVAGVAIVNTARAEVTADFKLEVVSAEHLEDVGAKNVTGDRLILNVTMHGIKPGEKFEYYFRWISPDEMFRSSEYPTVEQRTNGKKNLYAGDDSCDDPTPRCQCYCNFGDGNIERGCWRSRAYRTIDWTSDKGKTYRGAGTWKVELIRVNAKEEVVLGTGKYTVN